MARITIKDLPQSDALDREAMRSILGGGLSGARPLSRDQAKAGGGPIVDYPPGCSGQGGRGGGSRTPGGAG
jgi:hypothetical protein